MENLQLRNKRRINQTQRLTEKKIKMEDQKRERKKGKNPSNSFKQAWQQQK
ncbi:hypothetical protein SESBI_04125 [Sesbania bispinosa]|nr:hypothetical protein SESBI_04125 [Sesbania bispinosa]